MDAETIASYINLAYLILLCIMLFSSFIIGVKRGAARSFTRTLTIIISAVITLPIISLLSKIDLQTKIVDLAQSQYTGEFAYLLTRERLVAFVFVTIRAILTPLLFVLVFSILNRLLMLFIYLPVRNKVKRKLRKRNKSLSGASRAAGLLFTFIGACIVFSCMFFPINGYVGMLAQANAYCDQTSDESKPIREVTQVGVVLRENILFNLTAYPSDWLFNYTTKIKTTTVDPEGDKTYETQLSTEVNGVINLFSKAVNVVKSIQGEGGGQINIDRDTLTSSYNELSLALNDTTDKNATTIIVKLAGAYALREVFKENNYQQIADTIGFNVGYVYDIQPIILRLANCTEQTIVDECRNVVEVANVLLDIKDYTDRVRDRTYDTAADVLAETKKVDYLISAVTHITDENMECFKNVIKRACEEEMSEEEAQSAEIMARVLVDSIESLRDKYKEVLQAQGAVKIQKQLEFEEEARRCDLVITQTYRCMYYADAMDLNNLQDLTDEFLNSETMMNAIQSLLESEGFEAPEISEENKQNIENIINGKLDEIDDSTPEGQQQKQALQNLAGLFGIDIGD